FNFATAKPETISKPDDRGITRRLLLGLILGNRQHVLHAAHAWAFCVPVRLGFDALRFEAKLCEADAPRISHKRIDGAHAAIDRCRRKPALDLISTPLVRDRVRLAVFEGKEMRDRRRRIFMAGESGKGGKLSRISPPRVPAQKAGQPKVERISDLFTPC